ncbi:MAG: MerR family transcriptional regulator [Pelagibaca sp.]
MSKSADAFRTISEVAEWLDTPAHVLRFWESKFTQVKPVKRAGGRRYYRPADMQLLGGIKKLLHDDGMTIKGAQKVLREQGIKHVSSLCELSLSEEEDAELALLEDVPASEPVDTVVPFAKPEPAEDPDEEPIAADLLTPEPHMIEAPDLESTPEAAELEADPVPVVEETEVETASSAPEEPADVAEDIAPAKPEPEAEPEPEPAVAADPEPEAETALPGFLQRSMADRTADDAESESITGAPPSEPAEPSASALTHLSRIQRLTLQQAQEIAPILEQLKAVGR